MENRNRMAANDVCRRYKFPIIIEHRTSGEIKETEYKLIV